MPNSDHTSKQFDADLEDIRSRVLQMGGLVETQLSTAMEGLSTGNDTLINRVLDSERRVNEHEKEIDDACVHVVARRQPAVSVRGVPRQRRKRSDGSRKNADLET